MMRSNPPVDAAVLRTLYELESLTTYQIAARFSVARPTICRWLRHYGIPLRPKGIGLVARGIQPPTRDELIQLVHVEHLDYRTIARRYGVDFTAIPFWLDRHGIPKPTVWDTRYKGSRPILPDADALRLLYESGHTLNDLGERFGVAGTTIADRLREGGASIRPDGFGGLRFSCVDGHSVRSTYEQRIDNWLTDHGISHTYEPRLPFDRRFMADFFANGWYVEIWGVIGDGRYTDRKHRKVALYRAHAAPLIEITPSMFAAKANNSWERKITQCLTAPMTWI